ncbi:uroporphyrinogen decarboxylase [Alkalibaculum bacchi]|uniref:Uroporphyrinogen decarboxylase n=1 Tax=Alkalibaculum bacchi TaxID=645887 RepID=A0A366I596_9FIRM|nr:uroporphyrinogen decarboxylase family protein [Alkalibaculum bacchi]RBP63334.1 uroporphyrinogen decarboxylase [Alkalibaculum bacchi]
MNKMTSKERVLKALNHEAVDRVPIDLGGMACSIHDEAYFKLKEYLHIKGDIEPIRKGSTCNYYDERILDLLSIDIRRVFAKSTGEYPKYYEDGSFVNEWGLVQKPGKFGMEMVKHPLENAEIADLDTFNWPKAKDIIDVSNMKQRAKEIYEKGEHALSMRAPLNGIFEIACWLRGTETFLCDMLLEEEFAHKLLDKILEVQIDFYELMLDEVGPYVDIVETGDDYGSQNDLLISPDCLRDFILNRRKILNQKIKLKAPNCKIFLHCCGAIMKCIPDLIACGVGVLNPVQTNAKGMDPKELKTKYGDKLCFHGGIDSQKSLCGDISDIREEVEKMLTIMNTNGGYILTSCNHIQNDVSPENIIEMFHFAKKFSSQQ